MARIIYEMSAMDKVVLLDSLERELNVCVDYLISETTRTTDLAYASHWLRESPDRAELRRINAMGLEAYRALLAQENAHAYQALDDTASVPLDPRLIAAHMKHVCQQIPNGLVIDSVRDALLQLSPPPGSSLPPLVLLTHQIYAWQPTEQQIATVRQLLCLDAARYRCLVRVMQLANHILQVQQTDQITPAGLAVLLPVTSGTEVTDVAMLKHWHACFGALMTHCWHVFEPSAHVYAEDHSSAPHTSGWQLVAGWRPKAK
ncbi:hypothetical protein THASP1DRAFT_29168 [Thamnocephalis sphaerospora]|uniref:Uncharacterized protein n=1 Tax=Thamnocephalis sphaerospora TaxID=78915 RepID=A0A4V1IWX1_9FUNG|nr:hypothetical protein THASP1DRAFT_29168 [Thamnocephalis sphaerospora]|eukprot:RKP09039.1 hypothetical protein THASP1DRAFT_29168 [Thamnocephalis sphaerospora]